MVSFFFETLVHLLGFCRIFCEMLPKFHFVSLTFARDMARIEGNPRDFPEVGVFCWQILEQFDNVWEICFLEINIYEHCRVEMRGRTNRLRARAAHAVCLNVSVVLLEELVWYLPVERLSSLRPNWFPCTSICVPFLSVFLRSVFLFIVAWSSGRYIHSLSPMYKKIRSEIYLILLKRIDPSSRNSRLSMLRRYMK